MAKFSCKWRSGVGRDERDEEMGRPGDERQDCGVTEDTDAFINVGRGKARVLPLTWGRFPATTLTTLRHPRPTLVLAADVFYDLQGLRPLPLSFLGKCFVVVPAC